MEKGREWVEGGEEKMERSGGFLGARTTPNPQKGEIPSLDSRLRSSLKDPRSDEAPPSVGTMQRLESERRLRQGGEERREKRKGKREKEKGERREKEKRRGEERKERGDWAPPRPG